MVLMKNLRAKVAEEGSNILSSFVIALNHILHLEHEPTAEYSRELLNALSCSRCLLIFSFDLSFLIDTVRAALKCQFR